MGDRNEDFIKPIVPLVSLLQTWPSPQLQKAILHWLQMFVLKVAWPAIAKREKRVLKFSLRLCRQEAAHEQATAQSPQSRCLQTKISILQIYERMEMEMRMEMGMEIGMDMGMEMGMAVEKAMAMANREFIILVKMITMGWHRTDLVYLPSWLQQETPRAV